MTQLRMQPGTQLRRARPGLGTVVEIAAAGAGRARVEAALEAGFAEVARVHALMSFHERASEVSLINRLGAGRTLRVAPDTFTVLAVAQRIAAASEGAFDITVAPELTRRGHLPHPQGARGAPAADANWRDLELLEGSRVRKRKPLWIDLGGIAKGYAVDLAVAAMRHAGASAGLVNAGGDMRAFGDAAWPVAVRIPPGNRPRNSPDTDGALRLAGLRDMSLASSAWAGAPRRGPHVDPAALRGGAKFAGVSVFAPECVIADALTKVLMARGCAAGALLAKFGAQALTVARDGGVQASRAGLLAQDAGAAPVPAMAATPRAPAYAALKAAAA